MMECFCDTKELTHFTFSVMYPWMQRHNLWGDNIVAPYKEDSNQTQKEISYFDERLTKRFVDARGRDLEYKDLILGDLDNAVLVKSFGEHHEEFKAIAEDVYGRIKNSFGLIRVVPYAPAEEDNIANCFLKHLESRNIFQTKRADMINDLCCFSEATMSKVVADICNLPAGLSPQQSKRWIKFLQKTELS